MFGVIAGDVIGSRFEWAPIKTIDFPLFHPLCSFTDDTVLTVATASALLRGTPFDQAYLDFGRRYPKAGYGGNFRKWLAATEPRPYNSYGNGAVGFLVSASVIVDASASVVVKPAQKRSTRMPTLAAMNSDIANPMPTLRLTGRWNAWRLTAMASEHTTRGELLQGILDLIVLRG